MHLSKPFFRVDVAPPEGYYADCGPNEQQRKAHRANNVKLAAWLDANHSVNKFSKREDAEKFLAQVQKGLPEQSLKVTEFSTLSF